MARVKLSMDDMALIAKFEQISGISALDVVRDDEGERIIIVVRHHQLGKAVGRGGTTVKAAADIFGRAVDIVEIADTAEGLIKNALAPARVEKVRIVEQRDGSRIALVTVQRDDMGIAIGRDGRNVARARILAKRHFDIDSVSIA